MSSNVFPVPPRWAEKALVDRAGYRQMVEQVGNDPDGFWREQARRIDWIKPFTTVKDCSFAEADFRIRWFADGTLLLVPRKNRRAIASPDVRTLAIELGGIVRDREE